MISETLPQHFLDKVQKYGANKVAVRQKEFGIWHEYHWQDSYENAQTFALGMLTLGLKRGDHVATVGDNDRQYFWGYVGILGLGAVQVGLFTDASANEAAYIIDHSDARFVMAQDQEQVDKMLEIRDQIPKVERVIYWDERGLWGYDDPWLISFDEVQEKGRTLAKQDANRFEDEVAIGQEDDLAILCYTSGTTGNPKGAMLSHANLLHASKTYAEIDPRYDTDNHVSLLPLGWIAEHALGVAPHCLFGFIINFPEEPETVQENVREIAPEGILFNSRLWDATVSMVQVRLTDATWLNRTLYDLLLPLGYQVADKRLKGEAIDFQLKLLYGLGDLLFFAPLRDKLGLSNIRAAYTAGAALSPDVMRFFHAIGVNLKQIYGSTETTGGVTVHRDGEIKFASVGKPVPGTDIRIANDGEIQISCPSIFRGYYKQDDQTNEVVRLDADGKRWFLTGDAGYLDDDGDLIYLDRVKDMLTLSTGDRYSPQFIEGRLKFNPYIRDVMAVGGEDRDYVTALVIIEFDNVGRWAEKNHIGYTTFADLSQKSQVYDLITNAVQDVNSSLPEGGRVKRLVLMHKEFDADEAEMTRSRKLRRGFLYERYGSIIEALYSQTDSVTVQAPVRYQDGTEGVIETDVRLMTLS
ncbi:MAG: AMP-binding protein [Chloroflexota bacterium]